MFGFMGRLVVTFVPDFLIIPGVTLTEVYALIRWSFEQLAAGRWPTTDPSTGQKFCSRSFRGKMAGQELLGGFIGILDGFSADLQYYAQTFGIDHYGNNSMCHLCAASKVDPAKWFTQTGAGAGWQGTQVTNAAWHAELDAQGGTRELAKNSRGPLAPPIHL